MEIEKMKAMTREILILNSKTLQGVCCIRDALSISKAKCSTSIINYLTNVLTLVSSCFDDFPAILEQAGFHGKDGGATKLSGVPDYSHR